MRIPNKHELTVFQNMLQARLEDEAQIECPVVDSLSYLMGAWEFMTTDYDEWNGEPVPEIANAFYPEPAPPPHPAGEVTMDEAIKTASIMTDDDVPF